MVIKKRNSAILRADKFAAALTLVETLVAMVILTVAVIGASGYRYYAMLDARKAWMQRTGAAIALLLCENWRGRGYDHTADFDPVTHLGPELSITGPGSDGPGAPAGFTARGKYQIVVENTYYWATLSYRDEPTPGLRSLNVTIAWHQASSQPTIYDSGAKVFRLTTFVSN